MQKNNARIIFNGEKIGNSENDFDKIFNAIKRNHSKFFIPLINDKFQKNYSLNEAIELLPTDEYINTYSEEKDKPEIVKRVSDFIIKIRNDMYLLECQSYNDGSMALRIAEYSFLTARHTAVNDNGRLFISMPHYSVIYIRSNNATPKRTEITYIFPNGEMVKYDADNLILSDYTKEEIIKKKLYVLIPFYLLRYESIMKDENADKEELDEVAEDLKYFLKFLSDDFRNTRIDEHEYKNLLDYMAIVIEHVTNGNKNERKLVKDLYGDMIVTRTDKIFYAGRDEGYEEGIEKGRIAGESKLSELIKILLKENRLEDIDKVTSDSEYRHKLYEDYGIS